jgi:hypothetical protein
MALHLPAIACWLECAMKFTYDAISSMMLRSILDGMNSCQWQ